MECLTYPRLKFFAESIRNGEFPHWNPLIFSGVPYAAEPRSQAFYPLTSWLFALCPRPGAIFPILALHLSLAGVGTSLLARECFNCGWFAAACGGVVFAFSGFMCHWSEFIAIVCVLAWMPWVFYAGICWLRKPARARLAVFSVLWCLMIITGGQEVALKMGMFMFIPLGLHLVMEGRNRDLRQPAGIVLGLGLGTGLSALQTLPSIQMFIASKRAMGYGVSEAARESMPVWRFFAELFVPNLWGFNLVDGQQVPEYVPTPFAGYVGLCAILLFGYGIIRYWNEKACRGWCLIALMSVVLSWGQSTPIYSVLYPLGLKVFRHVSDFIIFFTLAAGVLAAGGIEALLKSEFRATPFASSYRRAWPIPLVACGAAMLFCLMGSSLQHPFRSPFDGLTTFNELLVQDALITVFSLTALGAALVVNAPQPKRVLIFVSLYFPLFAFVRGSAITRIETPRPAELEQVSAFTTRLKQSIGPYRIYNDQCVALRAHKTMPYGLPEAWGYVSGLYPLQRYHILQQQMLPDSHLAKTNGRRLMDLLCVKYQLYDRPVVDETLELEFRIGDLFAYRNPHALPRMSFVTESVIMEDDAALKMMSTGEWDPSRQVILPEEIKLNGHSGSVTNDRSSIFILEESANRVVCEVNAEMDGIVVLRDAYYPGWQAEVDGFPASVTRADFMFRAVGVVRGTHKVEFIFRPASQHLGFIVSAVSLLLIVLMVIGGKRTRGDNGEREIHENAKDSGGNSIIPTA